MLGDGAVDAEYYRHGFAGRSAMRRGPSRRYMGFEMYNLVHDALLLRPKSLCSLVRISIMLNRLGNRFLGQGRTRKLPFYRHRCWRIANRLVAGFVLQLSDNQTVFLVEKQRLGSILSLETAHCDIFFIWKVRRKPHLFLNRSNRESLGWGKLPALIPFQRECAK